MNQPKYLYEPGDVDTSSVRMLPEHPELFYFEIVLSGEADPFWQRTFEQVWKESRYIGKLAAWVTGERISVVCHQKQGMEDYLYLIESRIRETNQRVKQYWNSLGYEVHPTHYQHYPSTFRPLKMK